MSAGTPRSSDEPRSALGDEHVPVVSVVIPARNAAATIGPQLAALVSQDPGFPFEVVVADNGSIDSIRPIVVPYGRGPVDVTVVDAHERDRPGYARNVGVGASRGKLLLFCDADDVVDASWIREMAGALLGTDVVGGRIETGLLNDPSTATWRGQSRQDALLSGVFLPAGISANMAATARVFDAIEGFNEDLVGGEDLDFFWRAQLAGFSVGFASDSVVQYRLRADVRSTARQAFTYGRMNAHLFRLHRGNGMRRRPARLTLRQTAWVILHAPDWFRGRDRRGQWTWGAANLAGRIVGAAECRTLYI
jgi:glycosyltransferase involved in cell wall biosynthesis